MVYTIHEIPIFIAMGVLGKAKHGSTKTETYPSLTYSPSQEQKL